LEFNQKESKFFFEKKNQKNFCYFNEISKLHTFRETPKDQHILGLYFNKKRFCRSAFAIYFYA